MREPGSLSGLLPHDKEAEQGVLGAVIQDNDALPLVADVLKPECFFSPAHQALFEAMLDLSEGEEPIDEITLASLLRTRNKLEQVGGLVYIAELVDLTPAGANVMAWAEIVLDKHQLRTLISAGMDIAAKGRKSEENSLNLIQQAEQTFMDLAAPMGRNTYASLKDLLITNFEALESAEDRPDGLSGIPTGFTELDALTNGLQPSDLIILAARPSMGKTSLALNIGSWGARAKQKAVLVFSLEMSKEQMARRMMCSTAKVDSQKLIRGTLDDYEWDQLAKATADLSNLKVFIDDTPEITTFGIRAVMRRIQAEHELGLVVVDYLQLMRSVRRKDNREQEIAEISRGLKALAKDFSVPVLACAQLNRALESRTEKRPRLSDLRESGSIEQDADLVMFIYRDEVYNSKTEDLGIAEIHVAKNRNGPITTSLKGIRLAFIAEFTKFGNLALTGDQQLGPPN